jgi:hypothetical protein
MMSVVQVAVYSRITAKHKYCVGRAYNCWMLNLLVHHVTSRLLDCKIHRVIFKKSSYNQISAILVAKGW